MTSKITITNEQTNRTRVVWQAFNQTATAFMTAQAKAEKEIEQARAIFAQFLDDAGGDETLAHKLFRLALNASKPRSLSDAQIAILPVDESLEDAHKKDQARLRKAIERFVNLVKHGKREPNAKPRAAKQNTSDALSTGDDTQDYSGRETEVDIAPDIAAIATKALVNARGDLLNLQAMRQPIDFADKHLTAAIELVTLCLDIAKGKLVSAVQAQQALTAVMLKVQR